MANYEASARSNYFKIKEGMEEEFRTFAEGLGWQVDGPDTRDEFKGMYCLLKHEGGIPTWDMEKDYEVDEKDYCKFLAEDTVLHLTESGFEKMRYLSGYGVWILPDGRVFEKNIHDAPNEVFKYAQEGKFEITHCAY
jgi:hypothetical protein